MDHPADNKGNTGSLLTVSPGSRLRGEVGTGGETALPGDKSLSHRGALFGALAEETSTIRNFLVSGVTQAMLDALTMLEVPWRLDGRTLTVQGAGLKSGKTREKTPVRLDCGNSATTLRLLAGALAAWGRPAVLDGSPGLRRRPMKRIIEPLRVMGVDISGVDGCAPLRLEVSPRPLKPLDTALSVASAQVKSCILLAALAADGETRLSEPGPSRDHTERMLRAMGVRIWSGQDPAIDQPGFLYRTHLQPPEPLALASLDMTLPGDISAAAFLIVAALIAPGSEICLKGVGLNPTRTGLLETLLEMGADITISALEEEGGEPLGNLTIRTSTLRSVLVSGERVVRMIDEFPAFAIAAACASGVTRVADAQELRHKESDRISALGGELRHLGIKFSETSDGFAIQGGEPIRGGLVQSHGDHRLAMALALAGLAAEAPVTVAGAEIIRESFPDFISALRSLGAETMLAITD